MITIGSKPHDMSDDEANEYLKIFCEMHPYERKGSLTIETDGEYADVYLDVKEKTPFQRIRRITGYLVGTLDRFNNAKRAEVEDRVKHNT